MFARCNFLWWMVCTVFLAVGFLNAQNVSFVAVADNRSYVTDFRTALQEINDRTVNPEPGIPYPQFLVACGDFDPVASNMAIYEDTLTYPNLPPFYPVVGNHEFETPSDMDYVLNSMIPYLKNVVNRGKQGTYSFDYGNVHCIVLDQYSTNDEGQVDANLLAWLQQDLNATERDHVFVFGHEPAFPRHRHIGDSLDQFRESRDEFWTTLAIDPRVRVYFCGHTHYYYRMRVVDPTTVGISGYPDQEGGIYQVDCGAAGHTLSDGRITLVYAYIEEDSIRFRVVTSPLYEADWEVTDEWILRGVRRFGMQLTGPLAGDEIFGVTNVTWSLSGESDPSRTTTLYVSTDAGAHWDTLGTIQAGETLYAWNTVEYPDGTRYMLRVVSKCDSGFGLVQSERTFTINNPGNGAPEVTLNTPVEGDVLIGDVTVEWEADDADGDPLFLTLETSVDGGATWYPLATDEPNDGIYAWNTRFMPNSTHYKLKVKCTDGMLWAEEISETFAIQNEREVPSDLTVNHLSGVGSGTVMAYIVDRTALTEHRYRLTFDDTTSEMTTCDVLDLNTETLVVDDAVEMDGQTEGPLFDGLRLVIYDYLTAVVDLEKTGWTVGGCDLTHTISLPEIQLGTEIIRGIPSPADYEIRVFDHIVDTSSSFLGAVEVPIPFTVWNMTEDHGVDVIFNEIDGDHTISRLDEVYVLEENDVGETFMTWLIFFVGRETYIPPVPGDVFTLRTLKPFTHRDVFEFTTATTFEKGDVTGDGSVDVLDVVVVVRHILGFELLGDDAVWRAECNGDNIINILDLIGIVNVILGIGECVPGK